MEYIYIYENKDQTEKRLVPPIFILANVGNEWTYQKLSHNNFMVLGIYTFDTQQASSSHDESQLPSSLFTSKQASHRLDKLLSCISVLFIFICPNYLWSSFCNKCLPFVYFYRNSSIRHLCFCCQSQLHKVFNISTKFKK